MDPRCARQSGDAIHHAAESTIRRLETTRKPAYDMPADAVPCYDIAGNLLFQHSMDAGDRWMLMDAAGKPMLAWDFNDKAARQCGDADRTVSTHRLRCAAPAYGAVAHHQRRRASMSNGTNIMTRYKTNQ